MAFSRKNTVAVIDAGEKKVLREIPVGVAPFGIVGCEKQGRLFVSNRGGRRVEGGEAQAPSSGTMVATDPATGSSKTGTVSVIDLKSFEVREVNVGRAPSMMAMNADATLVAVANGHSDSVSLIDTKSLKVQEVRIPAWPENTLGSQPVAVAFSPDGQRLYAACGGINAVAVVERSNGRWNVKGAVPTGGFPQHWPSMPKALSAFSISRAWGIPQTSAVHSTPASTRGRC